MFDKINKKNTNKLLLEDSNFRLSGIESKDKQMNRVEKEIQKIDNIISCDNLNALDSINKVALINLYKQTSEHNQEKKYSQEEKKIVLSSFSNYLSSLKLFLDDNEFEKKCEKLPKINSHIITKVEKSLGSKNMFDSVNLKLNPIELAEKQTIKGVNENIIGKFIHFYF